MKLIYEFQRPIPWGAIMFLLLFVFAQSAWGQTIDWIRQLGTNDLDQSHSVSADGLGNVYISGFTRGNLGGANQGGLDAFVSKYDHSGNLLWTSQLGTDFNDRSFGVSADGLGNVYISGSTGGDLDGTNAGELDAFVSKYDGSANLLWTRQFGGDSTDQSNGVSADGLGNVYMTGNIATPLFQEDVFLNKYDDAGNLLWTRQLGTVGPDDSFGVSADGLGNVYISGVTDGDLGGPNAGEGDIFVSKFDADGNLLWTAQIGTSSGEFSSGVSADGLGNVYISGGATGDLGIALVSKLDSSGNLLWTSQLETAGDDAAHSVSADGFGSVYISGLTEGSLGGPNSGFTDPFVSKFDASGNHIWTRQLGTSQIDESYGVSADGLGNVYFSGFTQGNLAGTNAGQSDIFVIKIVPEPNSLAMFGLAAVAFWKRPRRIFF